MLPLLLHSLLLRFIYQRLVSPLTLTLTAAGRQPLDELAVFSTAVIITRIPAVPKWDGRDDEVLPIRFDALDASPPSPPPPPPLRIPQRESHCDTFLRWNSKAFLISHLVSFARSSAAVGSCFLLLPSLTFQLIPGRRDKKKDHLDGERWNQKVVGGGEN